MGAHSNGGNRACLRPEGMRTTARTLASRMDPTGDAGEA